MEQFRIKNFNSVSYIHESEDSTELLTKLNIPFFRKLDTTFHTINNMDCDYESVIVFRYWIR